MNTPPQAPGGRRRLAAIAAIVLPVAVIVWTGAIVVSNVGRVVVQLSLFAIATFAAWYVLTRVGVRRLVAAVIAVAAIAGVLVAGYFDDAGLPALVLRIVLLLLAVALARFALGRDLRTLKEADLPGAHVPPAARGVLIMNLKSGAGRLSASIWRKNAGSGGSSRSTCVPGTICSSSRSEPSREAPT